MPNSHRHARHDKTVLSVSRPLRRCELDSRQLKLTPTENLKSEHVHSNRPFTSAHQTRHRQDRLVLVGGRCELGIILSSWLAAVCELQFGSVQFRLLRTRLYRRQIHYTSLVWLFVYCVCVSVFHVYFVAASDGEIKLRYMVAYNSSVMQTGRWTVRQQEAQLSPRNRAMRGVSWNLASCHATVQKLLVRQVLNQVSAVANWPVRQNRAVDRAWRSVRSTVVERRSSEVL